MNYINSILSKLRLMKKETHTRRVKQAANELYQVTEFQCALWLTFNGNLFCPVSLVKDNNDDAVALVNTLRDLYIKRNTKE